MLGRKSELPAGYRRCEYLESDGNQFIDFDIICNAKDIILTAVFLYNINISNDFVYLRDPKHEIYGQAIRSDGYDRIGCKMLGNNPVYGAVLGTIYTATISSSTDNLIFSYNVIGSEQIIKTIEQKYPDGTVYTKFTVFGSGNTEQRIYKVFLSKQDGTELVNVIPCIDKTGKPCMYDTVTQQPFYNQGTGEFLYKLA